MKRIVAENGKEMGRCAAQIIKKLVDEKPEAVLGLATGSTPVETYNTLIEMNQNKEIDFSKVKTVNLDEYLGLDAQDAQSYRYFMQDKLFNHINIDQKNTFVPSGVAEDVAAETKKYDERIDQMGGIDLQILGIGANGHVAFNEPNSFLNVHTHVTDLAEDTIIANTRFFNDMAEVPKQAITMGLGQIMKAKKIILLASGKVKADAVKGILSGKIMTENPASLLQLHPNVTLIIDRELEEALEDIK